MLNVKHLESWIFCWQLPLVKLCNLIRRENQLIFEVAWVAIVQRVKIQLAQNRGGRSPKGIGLCFFDYGLAASSSEWYVFLGVEGVTCWQLLDKETACSVFTLKRKLSLFIHLNPLSF